MIYHEPEKGLVSLGTELNTPSRPEPSESEGGDPAAASGGKAADRETSRGGVGRNKKPAKASARKKTNVFLGFFLIWLAYSVEEADQWCERDRCFFGLLSQRNRSKPAKPGYFYGAVLVLLGIMRQRGSYNAWAWTPCEGKCGDSQMGFSLLSRCGFREVFLMSKMRIWY